MINLKRILKSDRVSKALTGLRIEEFKELVPVFEVCLKAQRYEIKPIRKRKLGGGQKGAIGSIEEKLAYILIYLKVYPTFDVMGVLTDRPRSKCCESVQLLLPALEKALGRKQVLPEKKIHTVQEFYKRFGAIKDVFVDGSERRVEKPKKNKKRNRLYSGKKKATTRKIVVITDEKKRILILLPTKSGRRHDKRIADKNHVFTGIPPDVTIWTDTGFQGAQKSHPKVVMPEKASKNHPLTTAQKESNRLISGIRSLTEHAIGGLKRLKSTSDVYRNKLPNLDDRFNRVAAGLWNLPIQHAQRPHTASL